MTIYDFTCPYCEAGFDNTGDPYGQDDQVVETCPKCDREFLVTCSISVDYSCETMEEAAASEDSIFEMRKRHGILRHKS